MWLSVPRPTASLCPQLPLMALRPLPVFVWLAIATIGSVMNRTTAAKPEPSTAETAEPSPLLRPFGQPSPLRVEPLLCGQTFHQPITALSLPPFESDASSATRPWWVLTRRGEVFAVDPREAGEPIALLKLSEVAKANDEKLAAARHMILDPGFVANGFVYVVWSISPHEVDGGTRVSRFRWSADSRDDGNRSFGQIDPSTRLDVLTYPSGDHIGASLAFGPRGMLWITTGDGARPYPPDALRTAQNLEDLRGKVLRIDVRDASADRPHSIPKDNPFVHRGDARGEVYAFGIRNGFRSAFHPLDGSFWVADVGWQRCEMVHRIRRGGNHGWSIKAGPYDVNPDADRGHGPVIAPEIAMARSEAQSITGGHFVPGSSDYLEQVPTESVARGDYLFGCYMNGNVWAQRVSSGRSARPPKIIARTGLKIIDIVSLPSPDHLPDQKGGSPTGSNSTIAAIVDYASGGLYRLVANEPNDESRQPFPRRLSETGLFESLQPLRPAIGVHRYEPISEMDRGNRRTVRMIAIPRTASSSGDRVDPSPSPPIVWHPSRNQRRYPVGTTAVATLYDLVVSSDGDSEQPIETQLLVFDGLTWLPHTYRWNEAGTDADLVADGGDKRAFNRRDELHGVVPTEHTFASRATCTMCHNVATGGPLGFAPHQLPRSSLGDAGEATFGQAPKTWHDFERAGLVAVKGNSIDPMVDWRDETATLDDRARSFLDVNCSCCHMLSGGAASNMDLRWNISRDQSLAYDVPPLQGSFGIEDASIIASGDPHRSVLMYRVATDGPGAMPKAGSMPRAEHSVDAQAIDLLYRWIEALPPSTDGQPAEKSASTVDDASLVGLWRQLAEAKPETAKRLAADRIAETNDPLVEGMIRRWIPPTQRTRLVGSDPDVAAILAVRGDPLDGRRLFATSSLGQCRQCHAMDGVGHDHAPQLNRLPMPAREMLDHILHPSKKIDPEWQTLQVLTRDGEAILGTVIHTDESDVTTLRLVDGMVRAISNDDIENATTSNRSIMPEGLLAPMTTQQVADLLAYLAASQTRVAAPEADTQPLGD